MFHIAVGSAYLVFVLFAEKLIVFNGRILHVLLHVARTVPFYTYYCIRRDVKQSSYHIAIAFNQTTCS